MTLAEFDKRIAKACKLRCEGDRLRKEACNLEEETIRVAGVEHHSREPGFACWSAPEIPRYFNSPREVVEQIEKKRHGAQ